MWNTSFSNKTQLKIHFFYWIGPGSMYFYSFEPSLISTIHLSEQWRVHSPQEKNAGKSRRRMQEKQIKLLINWVLTLVFRWDHVKKSVVYNNQTLIFNICFLLLRYHITKQDLNVQQPFMTCNIQPAANNHFVSIHNTTFGFTVSWQLNIFDDVGLNLGNTFLSI